MKKILLAILICLISHSAWANVGSVVFNGTDKEIAPPSSASLSSGIMTVSVWIKTSASTEGYIFSQRNGGFLGAMRIYIGTDGKVNALNFDTGGCDAQFTSTTTVNDGNWHNILVKYTSANVFHIFIDNIESSNSCIGNCACGNLNLDNSITQHMCQDKRGAGSFLNGKIAELAVWTISLGTSDTTTVATAISQGIPLTVQSASLHQYYSLSECGNGANCTSANMFIDQSANAYNASPSGTPIGSSDSPFPSIHVNIIRNLTIKTATIN